MRLLLSVVVCCFFVWRALFVVFVGCCLSLLPFDVRCFAVCCLLVVNGCVLVVVACFLVFILVTFECRLSMAAFVGRCGVLRGLLSVPFVLCLSVIL